LIDHQHALELRFPATLREMSASAERQTSRRLSGLDASTFTSTSTFTPFDPLESKLKTATATANNNPTSTHSPLLIYLESFVYHAIYCTDKKRGKEDWTKRDPYWLDVANAITSTKEWKKNSGVDFLTASSHPQSGPSRIHPVSLSKLHRMSFLRTDLDVSGSTPKDFIVPYYADSFGSGILIAKKKTSSSSLLEGISSPFSKVATNTLTEKVEMALSSPKSCASKLEEILRNAPRPIFLLFAGSNAPLHGLREELGQRLSQDHPPGSSTNIMGDIVYTMEPLDIPYIFSMVQAKFCLVIRGDTSSSRRLFSAIQAGCIPVLISDWISLPFAKFIDYSTFSFVFPESILNNLGSMIKTLRDISEDRYSNMFQALLEARSILLFDGLISTTVSTPLTGTSTVSKKSIVNPVTLVLIESLMRREEYCNGLEDISTSSLCQQLHLKH